jgi:hypothetical protein
MQKQLVQLIDDTDGTDAAETINFALDGEAYEIDLNTSHAGELRRSIAEYVDHARLIRRATRGPVAVAVPRDRSEGNGAIRRHLIELGWGDDLNDRGRIPARLVDAHNRGIRKPAAEITTVVEVEAPPVVEVEATPPAEQAAADAAQATRPAAAEAPPAVSFQPATEGTADAPKVTAKRPARARKPKATAPAAE